MTGPPEWKVTLVPTTDAILTLLDVKLQLPSEFESGGTIVKVRCVMGTDCDGKTPTVGVPWLTRS
jgi:hypothetical protein